MKEHVLQSLGYGIDGAPTNEQTLELREQTRAWWRATLQNEPKLIAWLCKLYNTEKEAEDRFVEFAETYCGNDAHHSTVFRTIAEQEGEHSRIIEGVLAKRGTVIDPAKTYDQRYWEQVYQCVTDKETAAGIGFFAEDLSLQRMIVIIEDEETPDDLREMFRRLHYDEQFHVNALKAIAGKHGIEGVIECHSKGLLALGIKIRGMAEQTGGKVREILD